MPLTRDEIREKKGWVADQLKSALQKEFNMASVNIAHGITKNEDGHPDFYFQITDLDNPENAPAENIVAFARAKVQELVPESKPKIKASPTPRAY